MEPHRTGRNEPHASMIEPGRTLGPYLVLSTLSSGPRSTVYMAQDLSLDRPVALKTAPRGAISVIAEGRVLARFNHPHIVTLHGLWPEPPTLILEYLVGETLKARRERLGALPDSHVHRWMVDILSALETIHGQGLAHGAIRADNVFLTTDQRVKLLDFRQTSLGETPPMPADDVRAAGRLMQELLASEIGTLADVARGGLLGRYPTARALRLAVTTAYADGSSIETSEAQDHALAQASLAPALAVGDEGPRAELPGLRKDGADIDLEETPATPFPEPERPEWGRPLAGDRRLGVLAVLLLVAALFALKVGWPHRQAALRPVTHIAHAVTRLAHGVLDKRPAPRAPGTTPPARSKPAARTTIRPGAYAALAHAWGG